MSNNTRTCDPLGAIFEALDKRSAGVRTRRKPSAEALDAVLELLRRGHPIETACRAANIPVSTVYVQRRANRAYGRAFDVARARGLEVLAEQRFKTA